jgi:hypothetical protein
MITEDFYGRKQFIWWTGIVEDVNDPLKIGSVRVRIIGVHSEDKNLVPTSSLPWAQVMLPTTGANATMGPREGDWVMGFFQDSEYAQIPVVMGVFPGIESVQSQTVYREAAAREGGAQSKPRPSQVDRVIGEPTTVRISRGVLEGTLINVTNQDRKHVCDISSDVKKATNYVKGQFGVIIKALRDGIRALLIKLGFDPSGESTKLVQLAKAIKREIEYVTDVISEVNEMTLELLEIARQIRAMIEYILSLPDKLKKFLSDCLSAFLKAIAEGIADLFTKPGSTKVPGKPSELSVLLKQITEASKNLLEQTAQLTAFPAEFVETLVNPASAEDIEAAGVTFENYTNSFQSPSDPKPINTAQP